MRIEQPFHAGELSVQQRTGELEHARRNGQIISDSIPEGALGFIEQQSLAVLGSLDSQQNIWASVLVGLPGFLRAVDLRTVELELKQTAHNRDDPWWSNIECHAEVGLLIIDLQTRRRLRINGRLARSGAGRLRLEVAESYPNCPKYIQRRQLRIRLEEGARAARLPRAGCALGPQQQALIGLADTFFVASAHPERGVDASHRGGKPGFVSVLDSRRIRIPDYVGNRMFNTLGNVLVNPRAGLVFIDFERSRTLQLIGCAEIRWKLEDPANETGGTQRYWDFEIDRWLESDLGAVLRTRAIRPGNSRTR